MTGREPDEPRGRRREPAGAKRPAAAGTVERFTLDRRQFTVAMDREYGDAFDWFDEEGVGSALSSLFNDVEDALSGPQDLRVQTYPLDDALLVCVREKHQGSSVPLRQIASYSIETKYLVNYNRATRGECYEAIAEVLRYANQLIPALRALQTGEQRTAPGEHQLPEVTVYHASDGAVVVEIDTDELGEALHDNRGVPYLRVYVNDACVSDESPPAPLAGSRLAAGSDAADPHAPIGRLVVEQPVPGRDRDRH